MINANYNNENEQNCRITLKEAALFIAIIIVAGVILGVIAYLLDVFFYFITQ